MDPAHPHEVHFRLSGSLESAILRRVAYEPAAASDINRTAGRDLQRYYDQLYLALPKFKVSEACLIVDALRFDLVMRDQEHNLGAMVETNMQEEDLDIKWAVDGPALVARLKALMSWEAMAVWDAVERHRVRQQKRTMQHIPATSMETELRAVGLVE